MPLRSDPSLPWNLPGVLAYYQPVRAPDSLSARYNMAYGGDNRYRAVPVVEPAWSGVAGWEFVKASGTYIDTRVIPVPGTCTVLCRFLSPLATVSYVQALLGNKDDNGGVALGPRWGPTQVVAWNNGLMNLTTTPELKAGVMGIAGSTAYINGAVLGTTSGSGANPNRSLYIGGTRNAAGNYNGGLDGSIQSVAIYSRNLSAADVWRASRQMAYCDVNPDWSVWSPRRKWFPYVLAGGGFQAAWAAHSNSQVGTGVS